MVSHEAARGVASLARSALHPPTLSMMMPAVALKFMSMHVATLLHDVAMYSCQASSQASDVWWGVRTSDHPADTASNISYGPINVINV